MIILVVPGSIYAKAGFVKNVKNIINNNIFLYFNLYFGICMMIILPLINSYKFYHRIHIFFLWYNLFVLSTKIDEQVVLIDV
jgi:hypothetical protein